MKKIMIAFLMTIAFSNTLIKAGGETDLGAPKPSKTLNAPKIQSKSTTKDLLKILAALGGAGFFGYWSYICYLKQGLDPSKLNNFHKLATNIFYTNIGSKILNLLPKGKFGENATEYSGIIGNALMAIPFAGYAAYKLGSAIKSKLCVENNDLESIEIEDLEFDQELDYIISFLKQLEKQKA